MFNFSNSNRKETEERMRREGRLPPGQALTDKFPVLHYGPIPAFDESSWDFRLWGAVDKEIRLSWAEFEQLPRTMVKMDLHCVTRWSKFDTTWEGVSLHTLIEAGLLKLKADARFAIQHAENDFSANLPLMLSFRIIFCWPRTTTASPSRRNTVTRCAASLEPFPGAGT